MSYDDTRRKEARAIPISEVADRLGITGLKRVTPTEVAGPCPVCSASARDDRFGINSAKSVFNCRQCGAAGDGLALVQHVQGCTFPDAISWLVGAAEARPDPAEIARRVEDAEKKEQERQAYADRARAAAIRAAREIWNSAAGHDVALGAAYLAGRGIRFDAWPPTLRLLPDHPYRRNVGGAWTEFHRGACLVAAIQGAEGQVRAVHQTWIDPLQPGCKAEIRDAAGGLLPSKLVRGSKKGGAIRLTAAAPVLVVGEGIETTASALVAGAVPGAAYWAGVDLGNMAGLQLRTGPRRNSGVPDLTDAAAFVPPAGTRRLVYLMDGDSAPGPTRAKLTAGLRRAMAAIPGLSASIVAAPAGLDFNDLLRGREADAEDD